MKVVFYSALFAESILLGLILLSYIIKNPNIYDIKTETTTIESEVHEDNASGDTTISNTRLHGVQYPVLNEDQLSSMGSQIPINRDIPDFRPKACKTIDWVHTSKSACPENCLSIIIIFNNEPLHNLLRTVHSVLNLTPKNILHEILLIDDGSDSRHISEFGNDALITYINQIPKTRLIRNAIRTGIVGARLLGIKESTGKIFAILDSHVEVGHNWAEPLVYRIMDDTSRIVMPNIDGISTEGVVKSGGIGSVLGILWRLVEHSVLPSRLRPDRKNKKQTDYITSPTMAGGIFAADRNYFLDMGGYDEGITFWGAENIELSFRWWQCGGLIEGTECSRVAHLFGGYRGYKHMPGGSVDRNKLRTAYVWMDEYGDLAVKLIRKNIDIGDLTKQYQLKQNKNCKSFKWFLTEVWPESEIQTLPEDVPYFGKLKNIILNKCLSKAGKRIIMDDCERAYDVMYWLKPRTIMFTDDEEYCLKSYSRIGYKLKQEVVFCDESRPETEQFEIFPVENGILIKAFEKCLSGEPLDIVECKENDEKLIWTWEEYKFDEKFLKTIKQNS